MGCSHTFVQRRRAEYYVGRAEDTYPMQGFWRTPIILWILSMATLSWKLLSPGKEHGFTTCYMSCVDCRVDSAERMVTNILKCLPPTVAGGA